MRVLKIILAGVILLALLFGIVILVNLLDDVRDPRSQSFLQWIRGSTADRQSLVIRQREACPGAPFVLPSDGFIGLLYGDPRGPYSQSQPHQGIDIFSNSERGESPVFAAYDGYVRREPDWRSSLIIRLPEDPLQLDRQIWLYYTHMADPQGNDYIDDAFPPGVSEVFVEQGTLLGYTGDYNGNSPRGIGVHLHFSIVRDSGGGSYLNELVIENTLDPSPYLGMPVHYDQAPLRIGCEAQ